MINYLLSYDKNGKHHAVFIQSSENTNQWAFLQAWAHHSDLGDLVIAHICKSKKQALELLKSWNDTYILNGTFNDYLHTAKNRGTHNE